MITDYVMPKLAMAMNEGTINEWLVADGSHINKGSPVMVVETEKVSYDVEAPVSGFLHIILPVGETVPVETLVAKITDTEEEWQSLQGATAPASDEKSTPAGAAPVVSAAAPAAALTTARIKASPLARKLAAEAGLDLASVVQGETARQAFARRADGLWTGARLKPDD